MFSWDLTPNVKVIMAKINKGGSIKLKSFHTTKENH